MCKCSLKSLYAKYFKLLVKLITIKCIREANVIPCIKFSWKNLFLHRKSSSRNKEK